MPGLSRDNLIHNWQTLLKAVRADTNDLPGAARYQAALERVLVRAVRSRSRRNSRVASALQATRQLNADLKACQEAASSLRHFIVSVLGRRNEKLLRYGIHPLRRRGRTTRQIPVGGEIPS